MNKVLIACLLTSLFAAQSYATYVVVLKDGTRYKAKAKWTVVSGKAIVHLETGQALQLDPDLIDSAASEQATRLGLTNAAVLDLNPNLPAAQSSSQPTTSTLGSQIKLRIPQNGSRTTQATPEPPTRTEERSVPAVPIVPGALPQDVLNKFELAYENTGIFDRKVVSTGANSIRAELTIDTEDRVFNAISATSFLMVRNAGSASSRIDYVELFMKTTNGGSAGRFQMTRADAEAIDKRALSQQEYFVRKVIY